MPPTPTEIASSLVLLAMTGGMKDSLAMTKGVVIVTGEFDRYNSGISLRFRYCTILEYGGGYNAT